MNLINLFKKFIDGKWENEMLKYNFSLFLIEMY